jgi:histone acetyltransferase (RNA polymerase elongator complex component)
MIPVRPFIVPLFIPHLGCPHRCVFCDQSAITGKSGTFPAPENLKADIERTLGFAGPGRYPVQISFYGGTFLGLDDDLIEGLLSVAEEYVRKGLVHSIRFSTRPDSVTAEKIRLIEPYPVKTVELGVQSMDEEVLSLSNRGCSAADTEKAAALLSAAGYETGFQIMTGLPGDSLEINLETAERLSRLAPDFIRIYPALVLRGSALERMLQTGVYKALSLDEAVDRVKRLYLFFLARRIPVIRMGLQASEELDDGSSVTAGPYHPSFGHLVYSSAFLDMAISILGKECAGRQKNEPSFFVHSKNISKMRGLKNKNLDVLKAVFNVERIHIVPDDTRDLETLASENHRMTLSDLADSFDDRA